MAVVPRPFVLTAHLDSLKSTRQGPALELRRLRPLTAELDTAGNEVRKSLGRLSDQLSGFYEDLSRDFPDKLSKPLEATNLLSDIAKGSLGFPEFQLPELLGLNKEIPGLDSGSHRLPVLWAQLEKTNWFEEITAPFKAFRSQLETSDIAKQLASVQEQLLHNSSYRQVQRLLNAFELTANAVGRTDISLKEERLIVDEVPVDFQQVEELFHTEEDPADPLQWLEALLRKLIQTAQEAAPGAKRAAAAIMLHSIWPLLVLQVDRWLNSPAERRQAVQQATNKAEQDATRALVQGVPREVLKRLRIVTAPTLNVRTKPSRQSPRLSELSLGSVVYAVKTTKGRDWTLVRWSSKDDDQVQVQGWVFTRYLKKLRVPRTVPLTQGTATEELRHGL